ncbi:DUF3383 family protein [Indiicoccus explosivorum]|uniref:DUF3383 family protein n=1 Tax=Indiicoccus explosivorum TaxID=1917864 RepID=UPI000B44D99E|nr:DUF3383 family protein [Indiicoccus explosivorum]
MPLSDVTVRITTNRPAGTVGFGKPLIVGELAGGFPYTEYSDLQTLAADFNDTTEVYAKAEALLAQENRPEKFAVAAFDPASTVAGAITTAADLVESLLSKDWYFLIVTEDDLIDLADIAAVVEGSNATGVPKLFSAQVAAAADLAGLGTGDRTFVAVHPDAEHIDAAIVGAVGSREVGSVTWQGKTLVGITSQDLSPAEVTAIEDANGYAYVTKAGDDVTSEGKVLSGEYIDVMHGKDWVKANIEHTVQKIKNQAGKIPYTDGGIATLEAGVLSVLKRGFNQGIIAGDEANNPLFQTNFKSRAETSEEDRALRRYTGGAFSFELAGAIHEAEITGSISY